MKKIIYSFIFLAVLAFYSCSDSAVLQEAAPGSVKVSSERLLRIDNMVQQAVDNGWIAGASAFIARDGKIVYNKAFGVSDLEKKTPMKPDDIFRICSQTKAIVSIGLMMLYEEGKFLLDDPVSQYIPEFADPRVIVTYNEKDTTYTTVPAKREITIRDLLTHTSGIDYAGIGSSMMNAVYAKGGIMGGFGNDRIRIGDDIKLLGRMPLVHHPGEKYTYGLNVDVVGYLIEVLSGEPLDQFLKTRIFDPLGMVDTWFYLPPEKQGRLVKVSTENSNHRVIPVPQDSFMINYPLLKGTYFSGGAGLSSTTKDYATFLQMLLNNGTYNGKRLLARRTVELITSNQIGDLNHGRNKFGLGFEITTEYGQAELGVSEGSFSWGGYYSTTYWADPRERLVGLIFMQQDPLSHGEIQDKFKAMVYQALED
ncbi:MAG TPA: serine hydrolase domain-containing protein [Bacteroidales bacterium]|jgi:CubicO group peptidase (beta-lactamase class C family)|nr:serine hydrolase domain-containing protein [Bacteroidales bacterium]HOX73615.1 serine hydrolase domain-containing protein [Bacteroidales bacterium]HPM86743.1 serine hydrolase domain-containing protein [Bacteroidales bacterium]HQM68870.1 serine hydrolase domain-containing protein [Bacteroidales bacterium]